MKLTNLCFFGDFSAHDVSNTWGMEVFDFSTRQWKTFATVPQQHTSHHEHSFCNTGL